MIQYIGNCQGIIDWNQVLKELADQTPAYVGPKHDVGHDVVGVDEVAVPLRAAGYKTILEGGNLGWDMFFPGQNFDASVVDKF